MGDSRRTSFPLSSTAMATTSPTWQTRKKDGNDAFAAGKFRDAVTAYTDALKDDSLPSADRATILCNRAQCYLKLNENAPAVDDCTACLTLSPNNVKALFRRYVTMHVILYRDDRS